jgi:hypothetical protein
VIAQTGGNIGLGSVNIPGELFHIGDGNMLLEGGGEVAQNLNVTLVPLGKFRCTNRFRYIYKSYISNW